MKLRDRWNAVADGHNSWEDTGWDEREEFAESLLDAAEAMADRLGEALAEAQGVTVVPYSQKIQGALDRIENALAAWRAARGASARPLHPTVVCLCGSTRFIEEFRAANLRETLAGRIVLSIGCDTKSDSDLLALGELTEEKKAALDELHKRKIDLADEILVLNVGGCIGSSTRSEIDYAEKLRKRVRWLEEARGKGKA